LFAERTYADWCELFERLDAPWSPVQAVEEVIDDVQVVANGYIGEVDDGQVTYRAPTGPVQSTSSRRCWSSSEVGQHTEDILLELATTGTDLPAKAAGWSSDDD